MEEAQSATLAQFQAIANVDPDVAQSVLDAADWNLEVSVRSSVLEISSIIQAALAVIYDDAPPPVTRMEQLEVDDSEQAPSNSFPSRVGLGSSRQFAFRRLILMPVALLGAVLSSLVGFFARLLRIRPNLPSFSFRPWFPSPNTARLDPYSCSERLVRELEEESGVASSSYGSTSALASSSSSAFPVASTSKAAQQASDSPKLPSFHIGSYESALRLAKERIVPLCVILISAEHQDTPEFKRTTLRDPDLVRTLRDRDFVTWIGDIKYPDSYQSESKFSLCRQVDLVDSIHHLRSHDIPVLCIHLTSAS
jgi:FAS-associated factor 2